MFDIITGGLILCTQDMNIRYEVLLVLKLKIGVISKMDLEVEWVGIGCVRAPREPIPVHIRKIMCMYPSYDVVC